MSYNYPISFNTNNPSFGQQTIQSNGGKTLIFNSGESIHTNGDFFNGYLIDENTDVLALTIFSDINNQYIVPNGKRLYILSLNSISFNTNNPSFGQQTIQPHSANHLYLILVKVFIQTVISLTAT